MHVIYEYMDGEQPDPIDVANVEDAFCIMNDVIKDASEKNYRLRWVQIGFED